MTRSTALVIGAGLGGLAAALELSRRGLQVTVVEATDHPGGRCDSVRLGEHVLDAGPTLLAMPDVVARIFTDTGADMHDYLQLRQVLPNYVVHAAAGDRLAFHPDLDAMTQEVDRWQPGAGVAFRRWYQEAGLAYRASRRAVLERNFTGLGSYLRAPLSPRELWHLLSGGRLDGYLGRFFADRRLRDAFGFQTLYLGMAPAEAPALFTLLAFLELAEGIWQPAGGMGRLGDALARLARDRGVRFRYRTAVTEVLRDGPRASGVRLADDSMLPADLVVINADLPVAHRTLLQETVPRHRLGASAAVLYLALEGRLPDQPHHAIYLPTDPAASYRSVCARGELPEDLFLYAASPSVTQRELSPEGEQGLYVLTMAPHLGQLDAWEEQAPALRARMLDRLSSRLGVDLQPRVKASAWIDPRDFARRGLEAGAAFGFSHSLSQVAGLRPSNRHPTLHNLYFAGANTHPGGGVPMVLLSGRLAAERALHEHSLV